MTTESSSGKGLDKEINIVETSLGITRLSHDSGDAIEVETADVTESSHRLAAEQAEEEKHLTQGGNDETVDLDLSMLRGIQPPEQEKNATPVGKAGNHPNKSQELEGLSELLPAVKDGGGPLTHSPVSNDDDANSPTDERKIKNIDSMLVDSGIDKVESKEAGYQPFGVEGISEGSDESSSTANSEDEKAVASALNPEVQEHKGILDESSSDSTAVKTHSSGNNYQDNSNAMAPAPFLKANEAYQTVSPYSKKISHDNDDDDDDKNTPDREPGTPTSPNQGEFQHQSSAVSLSTATQSHEVRMPMYLPTFRPATGCTNASDFIVRCFVARLRSGITVVKHGRSRWCKSRLRILHVHSDGRSLSWRPAQGEPTSSKRPPKLDLSTCIEVRHAWSPDPLNPMFTGTPILRAKCEAANAFKSFALIFQRRTVDITAVTADQCKVLMEGFSALCFRLQVANMAGRERNGVGMQNGQTATDGTSKDPISPGEISAT